MQTLFRREVLSERSGNIAGAVSVAIPVPWQAVGYLLFASVLTGLVFISCARYARVEFVAGAIVPDAGVSAVVPTRAGVISSISVHEGQVVAVGTELATIRAEEDSASGVSAASRLQDAISRQDVSLEAQANAAEAAASAQQRQLAAQAEGLRSEIDLLHSQITLQQDLVASAAKDAERARTLLGQGYLSPRELQNREESLISRQQTLAQLQQSLATRKSALAEAGRSSAQVAAQARFQVAGVKASRAEVEQLAANAAGSRGYALRAPVSGRVTALVARVGAPAGQGSQLMAIVPSGSTLRAELAVPSSAIGFTKVGQEVSLAIDAFPYQKFGTLKGRILSVATSPVSQLGPNGTPTFAYPVRVALAGDQIAAFGRREALVSGMTLTARIITQKQSLLEWLFEPLFAVRRR